MKSFYIIVIDSGWPTVAHEVVQESITTLKNYLRKHNLFALSQEESEDFLRENPDEIGKDPIIIITDVHPGKIYIEKGEEIRGIRIDLGKVKERDEVIRYMQDLCKLIENEDFISDISWEEKKKIADVFFKDIVGGLFVKFLELII